MREIANFVLSILLQLLAPIHTVLYANLAHILTYGKNLTLYVVLYHTANVYVYNKFRKNRQKSHRKQCVVQKYYTLNFLLDSLVNLE